MVIILRAKLKQDFWGNFLFDTKDIFKKSESNIYLNTSFF